MNADAKLDAPVIWYGFVTPASACWTLVGALAKGHEEDQLRGISVPA